MLTCCLQEVTSSAVATDMEGILPQKLHRPGFDFLRESPAVYLDMRVRGLLMKAFARVIRNVLIICNAHAQHFLSLVLTQEFQPLSHLTFYRGVGAGG